jgi:hypothetical protein
VGLFGAGFNRQAAIGHASVMAVSEATRQSSGFRQGQHRVAEIQHRVPATTSVNITDTIFLWIRSSRPGV